MAETAISGAPAPVTFDDTDIKAAWARWLSARDELDALPDAGNGNAAVAAEAPYWTICDAAEAAIMDAKPMSMAGVAIKLRAALSHMLSDRAHDAALRRNDLDTLGDAGLEWGEQMLVSALRSLDALVVGHA